MKTYIANTNLPFGIKKGDILTDVNGVLKNSKGIVVPFNASVETSFFKPYDIEIKSDKFEIGDVVILPIVKNCNVYLNSVYCSKNFDIPAYTPFVISEFFIKPRSNKIYVVINFNDIKYIVSEDDVNIFKAYYFISSSGEVHKAVLGKDKKSDNFRMKSNNCYDSKDDAVEALVKILS
jgi:hypothetical protein